MTDSNIELQNSSGIQQRTRHIGFLLVDNFTMIALASAVEPLRMANQLSGRELYSWSTISETGEAVAASDGIRITPDQAMQDGLDYDLVFIVGGVNITRSYTRKQVAWLKTLARKQVHLGGLCTGAYLLADAGLLDGYDCSTHWECIASMQEAYPKVRCTNHLFVIDRDRITSSGGTVPLDMMLTMIRCDFGYQLTASISEMFICDRVRSETDHQRIPLRHVLGTTQPKLVEVVSLMEANIEEAIELDELASYVGLSRRQLERLFQKYLHCTPSKYYLRLRLFRARQLLKQTSMSIIDIAAACGFISTPHFSKCYREHMGMPPREERRGVQAQANDNILPPVASAARELLTETLSLGTKRATSHSTQALSDAQYEPTFGSVRLQ